MAPQMLKTARRENCDFLYWFSVFLRWAGNQMKLLYSNKRSDDLKRGQVTHWNEDGRCGDEVGWQWEEVRWDTETRSSDKGDEYIVTHDCRGVKTGSFTSRGRPWAACRRCDCGSRWRAARTSESRGSRWRPSPRGWTCREPAACTTRGDTL